ncbi:MAG TPA: hypothetical protein VHL78_13810 [Actinomycetota bacterium]|nr:hypothetical protein [Actinomycetota bacterium]
MRRRGRTLAVAAAGPALILASVLVVLHDLAFGGLAPSQQNDVLGFWLPNHCFLGRSLAAGNIPEWNPHVLGGLPMAADPQSGWMYLPAMALYAALPCGAALPAFIVLQPVLAGVGLYAFLRSERFGRPAATVGGLSIALGIAASRTAVSLPVAGALAWSAVLLATASRALGAERWSARVGWAAAGALAWGQLAAAHLSHGLVIGTAALVAYLVVRLGADVRAGRRSAGAAAAVGGLVVAVLVPVNLAYLLPRVAYLPHSTLGLGYDALREVTERLSGHVPPPVEPRAAGGFSWPLTFATSPGAFLGGVPLALAFAALLRRRPPAAVAAAIIGAACYVLSLPVVARFLAPIFLAIPYGDVYLHAPSRLRYGVLLAIPVLAATGVDGWLRAPNRDRWRLAAPGVAVFGVLPLVLGVKPRYLALAWIGMVVGGALLAATARRPGLVGWLPAVLAAELVAGALVGQAAPYQVVTAPNRDEVAWRTPFENLLEPDIDAGAYVDGGANARAVREGSGRYLTLQPWREARSKGYVGRWRPGDEGLLDNQRAIILGLEDVQGYNPVQLLRVWMLSRRLNELPPKYNVTVYPQPGPVVLDLWQVTWFVGPPALPEAGFEPVSVQQGWVVQRGPDRPRASLLTSWDLVAGPAAALEVVASPGFDPSGSVVLEQDPGIGAPGGAAPGRAAYRALGPEGVEIAVDSPGSAILLVRNAFDRNWRASIDGRPAPVLPANHALQAVAVPEGRHVVRLSYRDPAVRVGLVGSGLAGAALALAWVAARRRERRSPAPERPVRRAVAARRA